MTNKKKLEQYDLIVIGAGSGGLGILLSFLELGLKVLLINKKAEKIGGECLNTGCVPGKALIHVAKALRHAKKAHEFGLDFKGSTSLQKMPAYIKAKQESIRKHENVDYLAKKGLDVVLGEAMFHSKKSVEVKGEVFHATGIVIAKGSSP